jgi:hypothetical protein
LFLYALENAARVIATRRQAIRASCFRPRPADPLGPALRQAILGRT